MNLVKRATVANVLYVISIATVFFNTLYTLVAQYEGIFYHQSLGPFAGVALMLGIGAALVFLLIANLFEPKKYCNIVSLLLIMIPVLMLVFLKGQFALE